MEQRDVLSIASVDRIRFYVKRKYEHLTKEKHAEIVADAIVKIIMRQLPPLPEKLRENICQELVKNIIVAGGRPVQTQDIYQTSLRHVQAAQQEYGNRTLLQLLEQWRYEQYIASSPIMAINEVATEKRARWDKAFKHKKKVILYGLGCLVIIAGVLTAQLLQQLRGERDIAQLSHAAMPTVSELDAQSVIAIEQIDLPANDLPKQYQYQDVDDERLKAYLHTRSSLLVEPKYFDAIIAAAKQFNISPILLFAITGQEQGFVPRDHEKAEQIANNPFNVFHSWQDYNTTIEKSAEIAARTIVNLSKDRPNEIDAITWINRKYAEDPNWSTGVISIYHTITNYINH